MITWVLNLATNGDQALDNLARHCIRDRACLDLFKLGMNHDMEIMMEQARSHFAPYYFARGNIHYATIVTWENWFKKVQPADDANSPESMSWREQDSKARQRCCK